MENYTATIEADLSMKDIRGRWSLLLSLIA